MKSKTLLLFAAICLWPVSVLAQGEIDPQLNQRRTELVKAMEDSKSSLAQLLIFREADLRAATKQFAELKELYAQGQVTKIKLDQAETLLTRAQNETDKIHENIAAIDKQIRDVKRTLNPDIALAPATSAQRGASSFNLNIEQLPPRYNGYSYSDLYASLLNRQKAIAKGEFESTIDYRSRLERLNQRALLPGVNFNSVIAFSLPPSETNFTLKYNADLTALDMSLEWQNLNLFGSYDHPYLALTWAESRRKIGSYIGRNAFNRSIRVNAYRIDKFYLEAERQSLEGVSSFTKGTLDGSFDTSVVMPPSVARLAKTNTHALVIGHLSSQPISYTHGRDTPTISDPYDRYEFTYALNLIVDEVWFYDYPTGNILVKLSKSPGS